MATVRYIMMQELPRLRRFAYSLTANKQDADDLVQSVIVKVLAKGLPTMSDPVPWLLTVCKNLWLDNKRREEVARRYLNAAPSNEAEHSGLSPDERLEATKMIEKLQMLNEGQRAALSLVAIEGLRYSEAARVLNVPVGTIMSRVSRARSILKERLR